MTRQAIIMYEGEEYSVKCIRNPTKDDYWLSDTGHVLSGITGRYPRPILHKKQFEPKMREQYYFISTLMRVDYRFYSGAESEKELISSGNCFKTKEAAELALDSISEVLSKH